MYLYRSTIACLVVVGFASALSCDSPSEPSRSTQFLFQHRTQPGIVGQFVAETSDPEVIRVARQQLELPVDERQLHINGPIARGNGGHNPSWSWHFIPDEWRLAEVSIELCDGIPQMVEDDLSYWIDEVGSFCPWGSYVAAEQ